MSGDLVIHRSHRYRLQPTPAQAEMFEQYAGVCRLVYNLAWEQRRDFWRQYKATEGRAITFFSQSVELTQLRKAYDWIAAVPADCQNQALQELDRAYKAFFARRSGYPSPRRKGQNDGFGFRGRDILVTRLNAKWAAIRIPKIGFVKARWTRDLDGDIRGLRIIRERGHWQVVLQVRREVTDAVSALPAVGIDRGIAQTLTLSTGGHIQAPDQTRLLARRKKAQRVLARRKRGSARHRVQRQKVAGLSALAARARTDWSHRTSTDIARRFGLVAIEDLNIGNMTRSAKGTAADPGRKVRQKAGLNRTILEQCWGKFGQQLDYKLTERGGHLISVPAAYTSQTCSACGVVDRESRKSQAVFACVHCGHEMNADWNAALEILRRSTSGLGVEGQTIDPSKRQPGLWPEPALSGMLIDAGRGPSRPLHHPIEGESQ